jgi:hypothetical protein
MCLQHRREQKKKTQFSEKKPYGVSGIFVKNVKLEVGSLNSVGQRGLADSLEPNDRDSVTRIAVDDSFVGNTSGGLVTGLEAERVN